MSAFTPSLAAIVLGLMLLPAMGQAEDLHLFILSGQSNMAGLDPNVSFTPTVAGALEGDEVLVVKDAQGGQPIRRWYKEWKSAEGDSLRSTGDLYDRLMQKVRAAVGERNPKTVTFVWMQGERDAKEGHSGVYRASLDGLVAQLAKDLGRSDINFVIGRLSDHRNDSDKEWDGVRTAQVASADASDRGAWIDTDDLNGPGNGLHYTKEGYAEMGRRFAKAALDLIESHR